MTWLWTELGDKDTYLENWKFGMCVNYPSSLYVTQSTRQDLSNTLKLFIEKMLIFIHQILKQEKIFSKMATIKKITIYIDGRR